MMIVARLIGMCRELASAEGWSATRLAREAGLHKNALRYISHDDWNPGADTLSKLEAVLRRERPDLFVEAA